MMTTSRPLAAQPVPEPPSGVRRVSGGRPLRFCMVTTFYPPYNFGGDGVCVERLANALAGRGHEVEVVHCRDAYKALAPRGEVKPAVSHPGVRVHSLSSGLRMLSPLATQQTGQPVFKTPALRRILDGGEFDVIHYHNVSLVGGPGVLAMGTAPVKLYTLHEHWLVCPLHVLWRYDREVCTKKTCLSCQLAAKRPPQWWRFLPGWKAALGHVDRFIAPSEFTRDVHLTQLDPSLPVVHLPHFLPHPPLDVSEVRADAEPAQARPYFLFVGRLEKIKGVQNLLRAFRNYDRADLVIAGEGAHGEALRAEAAGMPNVRFTGRLAFDELRTLYRDAVAVLVPSICVEVFGIIVIEAMSLGTPVIVNDLGALPEVVRNSGAGYVYHDEAGLITAMDALRSDPVERARQGACGRSAFLTHYTPEAHLARYFALVHEVARENGAPLPSGENGA